MKWKKNSWEIVKDIEIKSGKEETKWNTNKRLTTGVAGVRCYSWGVEEIEKILLDCDHLLRRKFNDFFSRLFSLFSLSFHLLLHSGETVEGETQLFVFLTL